jgi:hypothetical protein
MPLDCVLRLHIAFIAELDTVTVKTLQNRSVSRKMDEFWLKPDVNDDCESW